MSRINTDNKTATVPRKPNWHYVWASVLVSEALTVPVSYFFFGRLLPELIVLGLVMPLVASPLMIYLSHRKRRGLEEQLDLYRTDLEQQVVERTVSLRESEERYREIFDSSPIGIAVCLKDGSLSKSNKAFQEMLGYSEDEIKVRFPEITHPDDIVENLALFIEMLEGKRDSYSMRKRYIRKDGTYMWGNLNVTAKRDLDGNYLYNLAMVEDITEKVELEGEMLKSRNLESLGVLAGGIAHDFNNMLTTVLNNISVAREKAGSGEDVSEKLEEVLNKLGQARGLTRQLMTFAEGGAPVRKTASVASILEDTVRFCLSGSGVLVEFEMPDDLWHAEVDSSQISQVINNIALNAKDAMKDSGRLLVKAQNIMLEGDEHLPLQRGRHVRFTITDTGPGISEDVMLKVFDPYFTTKETGTGLGLAMAYSVVKKHNGFISVDSPDGEGAAFTVYLPASEDVAQAEEPRLMRSGPSSGLRVLIMDDDRDLIQSLSEVLGIIGHTVEATADGTAAVEAYKDAFDEGNPFDMVILDLTVPGGMGGMEAAERIRQYHSGAIMFVSTGYSNEMLIAEYREHGFAGVLMKPYRLEELKECLWRVSSRSVAMDDA